MSSIQTELTIGDRDVKVEIQFSYDRGEKGHIGAYGQQMTPDFGPELEVLAVTDLETMKDIDITDEIREDAERSIKA